jgi:hypothetical protein
MTCGQELIDWMILAKEEDENEHHSALIAAAFAKPLASVIIWGAPTKEMIRPRIYLYCSFNFSCLLYLLTYVLPS